MSVFGIKLNALNMLADWKKAQEQQSTTAALTGAVVAAQKCEKPPSDWVKINIDAALFADITGIGLGSIIRVMEGQFIGALSRRQDGLVQSREAEALCLKDTLLWLKDKGFARCIFETDCQILARACKDARGSSSMR